MGGGCMHVFLLGFAARLVCAGFTLCGCQRGNDGRSVEVKVFRRVCAK